MQDHALFEMDKTAFAVGSRGEPSDDTAYWLSRTPDERFAAIEFLRQVAYGYDPAAEISKSS